MICESLPKPEPYLADNLSSIGPLSRCVKTEKYPVVGEIFCRIFQFSYSPLYTAPCIQLPVNSPLKILQ